MKVKCKKYPYQITVTQIYSNTFGTFLGTALVAP